MAGATFVAARLEGAFAWVSAAWAAVGAAFDWVCTAESNRSGGGVYENGRRVAPEGGLTGVGEEGEDVALLFSQGVRDGHDAGSEAAASIALRTKGVFSPEDKGPELALGVIV